MVLEKIVRKRIRRGGIFCELSDELTEIDQNIDIVLIVFTFCAKIFF